MDKLRQAYEARYDLANNSDINNLEEILKEDPNIVSTNVYGDNTMYIESDNLDSLFNSVEKSVSKWVPHIDDIIAPIGMLYNILPITPRACIFRL